ncbi:NAD-dependent epimerase/dehydratase family protein [Haloferula sp.]|uniref:NAD-dependent epimerase/dehydratase family protein n=1 Tax=Haloferula sp. TaxID=2497595 RepID=UPI00329E206C
MHLLLCGHGYLGQAVSREFLNAGWNVTAVSLSKAAPETPVPNLHELSADLSSSDSIAQLADSIPSPDFIVHCAASGRGGPEAYRSVYLNGCQHLIDHFHGIPLLFTSSTSVYPQTDGSTVSEESPADPERETGQILRQTEKVALNHEGIVFRLAGIYGPGRSVILKKFLAGEATLEEDGRRILNQIHRDDAARAILQAALGYCGPGIWNVSDSTPTSQLDTYTGLAETFGKPMPPSVPRDLNRKRGWTHKSVDNSKLRQIGWTPRHSSFLSAAREIADSL